MSEIKLNLDELREMAKDGDIDLPRYKAAFKKAEGRDTLLSDDQILMIVGGAEDDEDDAGWVELMKAAENHAAPQFPPQEGSGG
jgi:hypothetical protein